MKPDHERTLSDVEPNGDKQFFWHQWALSIIHEEMKSIDSMNKAVIEMHGKKAKIAPYFMDDISKFLIERFELTDEELGTRFGDMQGGFCICSHHSIHHDRHGCTVTFCGCKNFREEERK